MIPCMQTSVPHSLLSVENAFSTKNNEQTQTQKRPVCQLVRDLGISGVEVDWLISWRGKSIWGLTTCHLQYRRYEVGRLYLSQQYLLVKLMHQKQQQGERSTKRGGRKSKCQWACTCLCVVSICACVFLALTFVDVECNGTNCDADHAFRVVEKLNGLGVQGKVISVLCVGDRDGGDGEQSTVLHHCAQVTVDHRERERRSRDKNVRWYCIYSKARVILKCYNNVVPHFLL